MLSVVKVALKQLNFEEQRLSHITMMQADNCLLFTLCAECEQGSHQLSLLMGIVVRLLLSILSTPSTTGCTSWSSEGELPLAATFPYDSSSSWYIVIRLEETNGNVNTEVSRFTHKLMHLYPGPFVNPSPILWK